MSTKKLQIIGRLIKNEIIHYNSISEMKADNKLKADIAVLTLGYYEANDGGGATYYIREKTDSDVDDSGSIHILDNGLAAELITDEIIIAEQFGAVGDGITDDSKAFENALKYNSNLKCMADKTYYFASPVDIRELMEANIDMNGSTFKNFQIYININDDLTDWRIQYRINGLRISNGYIGGVVGNDNDWLTLSENWNRYCIYAGGNVTLENVIFVNHLAVLARPAHYNDYLSFTDVSLWANPDLFTDVDTNFDAIAEIQSDGSITRITSGQGDGWIFKACHGWYMNDDFALVTFHGNAGATLINCIQSHFYINQFSNISVISCHFESTYPEIIDSYFSTVNFIDCYFYTSNKILDYSGITYDGCTFRALGYDKSTNGLSAYDFLGGKSIHELSCQINNSFFGEETYVNTDDYKRFYSEPKKTYHWEREYISFDCVATEDETQENALFDENGTYTYDFYMLPTNSELEANLSRTVTIEKINLKRLVNFSNANCFVGGWGVLVYRTSPSGVIHKSCIWTNTDLNSLGDITSIRDYGDFFRLSDDNIFRFDIWKLVDSKPDIVVNDKLFGTGYTYITTDDSEQKTSSGGVQVPNISKLNSLLFKTNNGVKNIYNVDMEWVANKYVDYNIVGTTTFNDLIDTESSYYTSEIIEVQPNMHYISLKEDGSKFSLTLIGFYDSEGLLLQSIWDVYHFETPYNCKYIRISIVDAEPSNLASIQPYEYKDSNYVIESDGDYVTERYSKDTHTHSVVLFESIEGNNTDEIIELSDDIGNYDTVEIIYGRDWGYSSVKVPTASLKDILMHMTYFTAGRVIFCSGVCELSEQTLLRGTKRTTDNPQIECIMVQDFYTSGELTVTNTVYTASTGFALYIYKVIGYKD